MMEKIEQLANVSVGRGCGFAALAIGTFMFALSYDMSAALQAGGILGLISCLVLIMRGVHAPQNPYKRTEVWTMLAVTDRPPEPVAQAVVGRALRKSYMLFAAHFAYASALMLVGSVLYKVIRQMLM
jgi:hypothetical protein